MEVIVIERPVYWQAGRKRPNANLNETQFGGVNVVIWFWKLSGDCRYFFGGA